MRFEPVELYLENSLFLLKARLCYGRINVRNQQGMCAFLLALLISSRIFAFLF